MMSCWGSVVMWFHLTIVIATYNNLVESKSCAFEAIFNFGDSNTDTGGFYAAFPSQGSPYGMTHFKKPTGRATDGRVIIDFLGIIFIFWKSIDPIVALFFNFRFKEIKSLLYSKNILL